MSLLNRYLATSFLQTTLILLLFLMTIVLFCNMVAEIGDLGRGHYGLGQIFIYTALTMPAWIYQLFPVVGLLGAIVSLGQLASRSELIVMRAAGISRGQIAWMILRVAFVLTLLAMLVGEGLGPRLTQWATAYRTCQMNQATGSDVPCALVGRPASVASSAWLHVADERVNDYLHFDTMISPTILENVFWYEFNSNNQLLAMSYSPKIEFIHAGAWNAADSTSTVLQYQKNQLVSVLAHNQKATRVWSLALDPSKIHIAISSDANDDPSQRSLVSLWQLVAYKKQNHLAYKTFQLALWQRLFQPFESLVMIFLAVPFVFGSLRNASMGLRLVVGVTIGFVFYLLIQYIGIVSLILSVSPILGAGLPMALFAVMGLLMIGKRF